MAKENEILYKCSTEEDFDMEEEYEGYSDDFNPEENKVFAYTFEVNPVLRHMLNRGYLADDIVALSERIANGCSASTYFYWDKELDSYFVRVEKGEIEGLHPKKRNQYVKLAMECFNEFFEELNKTY